MIARMQSVVCLVLFPSLLLIIGTSWSTSTVPAELLDRIEIEKAHLLQRLRLSRRPAAVNLHLRSSGESNDDDLLEHLLIPVEGICSTTATLSCFQFQLSKAQIEFFETVHLVLTISPDQRQLAEPLKLQVQEIINGFTSPSKTIATMVTLIPGEEVEIDMGDLSDQWFVSDSGSLLTLRGRVVPVNYHSSLSGVVEKKTSSVYVFEISCSNCASSLSTFLFEPPFLRIQSRERQSCVGETSCCLHFFYLNFTEIGWGDWIVAPKGYQANYCSGSCPVSLDNLQSRLIYSARSSLDRTSRQAAPCCTATRYAPLSIIYVAGENELRSKTIHGMKTLDCGCLQG